MSKLWWVRCCSFYLSIKIALLLDTPFIASGVIIVTGGMKNKMKLVKRSRNEREFRASQGVSNN